MEKRIFSIALGLIVLLLKPAFATSFSFNNEKSGQTVLQFKIEKLKTDQHKNLIPYDFDDVKVSGMDQLHEVGSPALPFVSFIAVGEPKNLILSVDKGPGQIYSLRPRPAQKMPCRCDKDFETSFTLNEEAYAREEKLIREVRYLGTFRGKPLTKITMTPFKYSDEKGLTVYKEARLIIQGTQGTVQTMSTGMNMASSLNNKYMIFAPAEYHQALGRLISHKRSQGYQVTLVDQDDLGSTYDSIKNSIHNLYKKEKFSFALIVGHEDSFPTNYVNTSNHAQTPSDFGYFAMDGASDKVPEVLYGRMVASSVADVENQITKTLEHEKRSWKDGSGFKNFLGIASDEGYNPSDVEYTEQFAAPFENVLGKNIDYFLQENSRSNPGNINKALNKGAYWINYIGHGSGNSWPSIHTSEYHIDDIKKLRPGKVKPVLIDVACQNGRFSTEGRLGERFMNETNQGQPVGTVAYYGGSVDISWHPPAIMARGINLHIADQKPRTLGESLLAGQLYLLANYDDAEAAEENLLWYHLQGDPTLQLQY